MDINEATAKSLQAARAVSGLTFAELSEKSGVPEQTIYRMFGAKRDIKLPQLSAVAHAMGMTVVEIMQDAERIQMRSQRHSQDAADDADAMLASADNGIDIDAWANRIRAEDALREAAQSVESERDAEERR
ncbi:helix-turn-helix domain-containing protein [Bifidobacterium animalis]|uniref:helix-turn-helix domain-containing protein n=1 Tax=Bifidobacterium animalis TaxID=28025 RepID=UPI001C3F1082|nr:helix-turn-helix transcriptional regulator [Bifidobacterium animalis]MCR1995701.1 helix-turn-helix domain-containing protein [Bifidobacterium animalis subsp. animalis]